jgi:DNA invertase Pin-like site-specific DNA recombinase
MIYAYARISKDNDKSVAVEDQLRKIALFAESTDRTIDETYSDRDASGRSLKRPQMEALLAKLQPGDTIIVHKLDRLTRNVRDLGDLLERKVNIVSVTESLDTNSASGRLVVNILATVAQWERETIAERTTASLAFKRDQNQVYGQVPYGYRREGADLVEDEQEQEALRFMQVNRSGGASYGAIATSLTSLGFPARGNGWTRQSVHGILKSLEVRGTGTNG